MLDILLAIVCGLLVLGALVNIARIVVVDREMARRQRRFDEMRDRVEREIAESRKRMTR